MDVRKKSDFCVSVGKTNFTDHHTPDTIKAFGDSVCKMQKCRAFIPIPSHQAFSSSDVSDSND